MNAPGGETPYTAVDVHAHHVGPGLPVLPSEPPRLVLQDGGGRMVRGDSTRIVPTALWDVRTRLAEMDRIGLSHQVISPLPEIMDQAWRDDDPAYARAVNDSILDACLL